jgi:hypothetical protein
MSSGMHWSSKYELPLGVPSAADVNDPCGVAVMQRRASPVDIRDVGYFALFAI